MTNFTNLPYEIFGAIITFVYTEDLFALSYVNKRIRYNILETSSWKDRIEFHVLARCVWKRLERLQEGKSPMDRIFRKTLTGPDVLLERTLFTYDGLIKVYILIYTPGGSIKNIMAMNNLSMEPEQNIISLLTKDPNSKEKMMYLNGMETIYLNGTEVMTCLECNNLVDLLVDLSEKCTLQHNMVRKSHNIATDGIFPTLEFTLKYTNYMRIYEYIRNEERQQTN